MSRSDSGARRIVQDLDDDEVSSGSDNEEGIPARSPRKAPLSVTPPTLSVRSLGSKRRPATEALQSVESRKRRRTASFADTAELLRGPGLRQPRSTGSHTPSGSTHLAQPRVGDDMSPKDGHNVQNDDYVDPRMLDLVNGLSSSAPVVVADSQEPGEIHSRQDSVSDMPEMDLGHNMDEEIGAASGEVELGDTDLGHEPAGEEPSDQDQSNPPAQGSNDPLEQSATDNVHPVDGVQASNPAEGSNQQSKPAPSLERQKRAATAPASPNVQERSASRVEPRVEREPIAQLLRQPIVSTQEPVALDVLSRKSEGNIPEDERQQNKPNVPTHLQQSHGQDASSSAGTKLSVPQLVPKAWHKDANLKDQRSTDVKRPKARQSKDGMARHEENAPSSSRPNIRSRTEPSREIRTVSSPIGLIQDAANDTDDEQLFVSQDAPDVIAGDESIIDLNEGEYNPNRRASQFKHDVQRFRDGQAADMEVEDSAFFDAPSSSSPVTIQLPPEPFSQARQLMQRLGWSAISNNWERLLMEKQSPETRSAQHMTSYLMKLGRVLSEAPSASDLRVQNEFLKEHSEMIKRYFFKIDRDVNDIRTQRLSFKRGAEAMNDDMDARQTIAKDLVRLVIPLLIAILGRGWALGQKLKGSCFTDFTIQILARLLGWTEKLYGCLMRELKDRPLKPESKSQNLAREALAPILVELREILKDAPNRLLQEDQNLLRTQDNRLHRLNLQDKIKRRRQAQVEAEKKAVREHNHKVASALSGGFTNYRNPRRAIASGSNDDDNAEPSNPAVVSDVRKNRQPTKLVKVEQWRREEELSLFKHLKTAFNYDPPELPELSTLVFTIGHSKEEIKRRAALLLPMMFEAASPEKTESQIDEDTLDKMIANWR
ncbi:hypothetical protein G7054_g90 [Neopestalotiopsis clavispora]|nr:hypothetical protein G7054_g90 [Neopestalotiopsis clavispora]